MEAPLVLSEKDLEDGQLGLRGLTGKGHVAVAIHGLARSDTGHMRAMVVAVVGNGFGRGDNIRILVGVVKSKGDLAALVEHIRRQQIQLAGGAVVLGIPEGQRSCKR